MTRSSDKREMDEIAARFDAEDRAVRYLAKFSAEIAGAIAFRVAWFLATTWEYEQREMIQRGADEIVFQIRGADLKQLRAMLAMIPQGTLSDVAAEQRVTALLANFPPDKAWWVANKVAGWAAFRIRREQPVPLSVAS
jgi:hypothetical protein